MCLLSCPFSKSAPPTPLPTNAELDPATTNMMTPLQDSADKPLSKPMTKIKNLRAKLEARMAEAKAEIRCMKARAKAAAKEIKHKVKGLTRKAKTPTEAKAAVPDESTHDTPDTPDTPDTASSAEREAEACPDRGGSGAVSAVGSTDFEELLQGNDDSFVSIPTGSDFTTADAAPALEPIAAAKPRKSKALAALKATLHALKPSNSFRVLFPATAAKSKKTGGRKGKAAKGPSPMQSLRLRMSGLLRRDKSGKDSASADTPLDCDAEAVVVVVRPASPAAVKVPLKSSELGHRVSRA
ncbi:hypothetical protein Rsub_08023 [Raphidocelis subcapitata]|uniref:Uncharacterized protein n=1 Tax=Raphidocelis subcapitata TaxID=307507 RepID=A0A2V0P4P5_9CHLO|nr:hypothetical protein Rsub_08023 [Raphidocelis subcapitata]|eukprot:GBF94851.1 hypothetical protein Rsub_08023 [Raphidocelis subcapitata]